MGMHVCDVRPRKDKRDADLISDQLPFGRLWYGDANAVANAIGYATYDSCSHDAMIRVHDEIRQRDRNAQAQGATSKSCECYPKQRAAMR
jgi:hypothetical protein